MWWGLIFGGFEAMVMETHIILGVQAELKETHIFLEGG